MTSAYLLCTCCCCYNNSLRKFDWKLVLICIEWTSDKFFYSHLISKSHSRIYVNNKNGLVLMKCTKNRNKYSLFYSTIAIEFRCIKIWSRNRYKSSLEILYLMSFWIYFQTFEIIWLMKTAERYSKTKYTRCEEIRSKILSYLKRVNSFNNFFGLLLCVFFLNELMCDVYEQTLIIIFETFHIRVNFVWIAVKINNYHWPQDNFAYYKHTWVDR